MVDYNNRTRSFGQVSAHKNWFVYFNSSVLTGTRIPRANWKAMSDYGLALPPVELAEQFNAFIAASVKRIQSNILENRNFAELRDTLLPKLISGEIRIADIEHAANEECI